MFWTSTNAHGSSGGGSSSEHPARTACRRIEIVIGFARAGFPSCRTPETVMMRGLRIAVRGMRVLLGRLESADRFQATSLVPTAVRASSETAAPGAAATRIASCGRGIAALTIAVVEIAAAETAPTTATTTTNVAAWPASGELMVGSPGPTRTRSTAQAAPTPAPIPLAVRSVRTAPIEWRKPVTGGTKASTSAPTATAPVVTQMNPTGGGRSLPASSTSTVASEVEAASVQLAADRFGTSTGNRDDAQQREEDRADDQPRDDDEDSEQARRVARDPILGHEERDAADDEACAETRSDGPSNEPATACARHACPPPRCAPPHHHSEEDSSKDQELPGRQA